MDTLSSYSPTEANSPSSPGAGNYNIPLDKSSVDASAEEDSKFKEDAKAEQREEDEYYVTDLQMLTIEDSTLEQIPPHLKNLLNSSDINTSQPTDLLFVLIYGIALECSLASVEEVSKTVNRLDLRSYLSTFHVRNVRLLSKMPPNIYDDNKMAYTLRLQLIYDESATVCLLTAIVNGDFLFLTLTPDCGDAGGKSVCLSIGRYVLNSKGTPFGSRFRKLHELSYKLREQVMIPIRNHMIKKDGGLYLYPGLDGLPDELYPYLYKYLNLNTLKKVSNVSKRFRDTVRYYKKYILKRA